MCWSHAIASSVAERMKWYSIEARINGALTWRGNASSTVLFTTVHPTRVRDSLSSLIISIMTRFLFWLLRNFAMYLFLFCRIGKRSGVAYVIDRE